MIRAAQAGDEAAIEAFLARHAETSMFLRSNLARFGLFNRDHPNATSYFVDESKGLNAVFGISNAGFVLCQAPDAAADFWDAMRAVLQGCETAGITGEVSQVAMVKTALGLEGARFSLDRPEPLYRLSLDKMPDPGPAELRTPTNADLPLLREWIYAYDTEALGAPEGRATRDRVAGEAQMVLESGTTRLLIEQGQTVAKTAFNATLPDMVQIGGVYTPPEHRNRGLARRAVAAHLREAQAEGVETAILFASGAPACRAYEAIGFQRIGRYALTILAEPQTIGATE